MPRAARRARGSPWSGPRSTASADGRGADGATDRVGALKVFRGAGIVMRCPQCDNALVTIVEDLPRAASPRTQRQQGEATGALEQLSSFAQASGTEAARAVLAGRNAQLRTGNAAENCDREEIGRLGHTTLRVNTLERSSATVNGYDAKATGWTPVPSSHRLRNPERHGRRRVRRTRPTRTRSNRGDGPSPSAGIAQILTAQEAHLARLAAQGLTDTGIGEALYLSPRTVEWHLRKVFAKLGVSTRRQLRRSLADSVQAATWQRPGRPTE